MPARSELGFRTRILGLVPVRGRYTAFEGGLHIDDAGAASGTLRVEAETVSTGIKKRDTHLRTSDFFAVERHPHMTFELTALIPRTDGAVTLSGTLHIRDRALPITAPVSVALVGSSGLRIDADFEVDHRAAGFEFKRLPRAVRIQAALTLEHVG
ncbi:MAG TPA: YceI family protein [Solirubrobacteraceae bacterium]|nr:YceI family protein [Solirubrobacteraceae bacterium]